MNTTEINKLQKVVCAQNKRLLELGLVILTEGNVSQRQGDLMAIKPSGVSYEQMMPPQMVLVNIKTGEVIYDYRCLQKPSVDTPTHLEIYRKFPEVGGVAHTHSVYATAWSQTGGTFMCCGTTHADAFCGEVPITRLLTESEVESNYEQNVGTLIVSVLQPDVVPAVLLNGHGPFTVGRTATEAVDNAFILEKVAMIASVKTPCQLRLPNYLLVKHFFRKHGKNVSYGQS